MVGVVSLTARDALTTVGSRHGVRSLFVSFDLYGVIFVTLDPKMMVSLAVATASEDRQGKRRLAHSFRSQMFRQRVDSKNRQACQSISNWLEHGDKCTNKRGTIPILGTERV